MGWWLQNPLWPRWPTVQLSVGKKASLLLTDEHAISLPTVVLVDGFGPKSLVGDDFSHDYK